MNVGFLSWNFVRLSTGLEKLRSKITNVVLYYFGILSLLTYLKAKCKKKKIMDNAVSIRHCKVNFILKYLTVLILLKKCDALRDLVSFVQFKNIKNTHGGVTF